MTLGRRQSVVIADQNNIGRAERALNLLTIQNRVVAAERFIELAKIFPPAVRILRANFTLHSCQRVQLRGAASGSKIRGGCHEISPWVLALSYSPVLLDFVCAASLCCSLANQPPKNVTVATTGASGSIFLRHLLLTLAAGEPTRVCRALSAEIGFYAASGSQIPGVTVIDTGVDHRSLAATLYRAAGPAPRDQDVTALAFARVYSLLGQVRYHRQVNVVACKELVVSLETQILQPERHIGHRQLPTIAPLA